MYLSIFNPMKKNLTHTCLPLHHSALFENPATTSRRPQVRFTLETNNLNYNLKTKKTLSVEKPSRDEAIKISPKQKFLKPL